jgi:formate dehydrogenase maturation protein FdhE
MARKKAVKAEVKPEVKSFEWGDLVIKCKCGHEQIIGKSIQHGLQLVLQTREDSFIQLECNKCNSYLKLHFIEGIMPPEPPKTEEVANESVQEENKQEQSL